MPCKHRFLSKYIEGSLLPDWKYDKLIIGTFNPSWDFDSENDAYYFYGRSRNYFWDILPELWGEEPLKNAPTENKESFLRDKKIALTDIILTINDADINNKNHYCLIKSKKDTDLVKFKSIEFNTENIIQAIEDKKVKQVFITNRKTPAQIENEFTKIEVFCQSSNIHFSRLMTPSSGARFGLPKGTKLVEGVITDWKGKFIF